MKATGKNASLQLIGATHDPWCSWLVDASLKSQSPSSCSLLLSYNPVIGFRAHPNPGRSLAKTLFPNKVTFRGSRQTYVLRGGYSSHRLHGE